ncbi:DUF819 family protein [Gynurincola endophyticus]|uniref:DUF819 family protein n=1 Tax=Gynurincola endophyticus TaxID=2479004 RepID=UPI000F8DCDE5|nr:DUF819 family protein [Gynurincola endophyticus]
MQQPLIQDDVVVMGILAAILGLVFTTAASNNKHLKKFYSIVPALLLCYFIPGILNSSNVISGEQSGLYKMASSYLLPASLVLFTLNLDIPAIWRLRKKAGLLFFTGTIGVMVGGPLAMFIVGQFSPETVNGETWKGLTTLAGSWIGGGANQTALFEMLQPSGALYSATIAVDVICANIWMALLIYSASKAKKIDKWLKADTSEIDAIQQKLAIQQAEGERMPTLTSMMQIIGVALGGVAIAHGLGTFLADYIRENAAHLSKYSLDSQFFWKVFIATLVGVALSFTKVRKLEGYGASKMASVFLYILIATIGMKMDILAMFQQPGLFAVGAIWITFHGLLILVVAKLTRTPLFFAGVGSMANIGAAASAPVVASAFNPALAPVGVILAILGYAIGTNAAYICGLVMQWVGGMF